MGIQLPPELVDVAAKAGVTWPEADEDKMRTAAAAWRDAGNRVTGLAGDSDGSATKTLTGITGATGDAARTHWNRVVAPDGDLNTTAKGCHAAADRLEHGADQIGAAKVELVRELVNLAKNSDAAQSAASAGHPTALLGLDTVLAGATANVSNLTNTLTSAVRLDSGVDVGSTSPPVNANPGSHGGGGLLGTVLAPVAAVVAPVTDVVAGVVPAVVAPVAGALPVVADVVADVAAPVTDAVSGVVPAVAQVVPAVVGPVTDVVAHAVPAVDLVSGTAPQAFAPVQQVVSDVAPAVAAPAASVVSGIAPPPFAVAPAVGFGPAQPVQVPVEFVNTTGGTVAQSAATLMAPIEAPVQQAPAQQTPAPPAQVPAQAPGLAAPPPAAAPVAPAAPAAGGAVVGAVQRTDQPVSQRLGGEQPSQQRTVDQTTQQRTESKPAAGAQSQAPGSQPQQAAPTGKEAKKPEDTPALAAFLFFRGPSGTAPQPSTRPKRQVEPTAAEVDHVNGLRFAPQDHPHADLISTTAAQAHTTPEALGPDHPMVRNLTDGYDPQAGLHEREWDGKFVRTAVPLEHAWPPAAEFPEGGYEAGRPDVLPAGTEVDRFGTPEGRVLAAAGTRFAGRSLPPVDLAAGYRRYVLTQPVPVWRTISVGWFGQPGGGTRYRTTYPVADLVALGYLMELA